MKNILKIKLATFVGFKKLFAQQRLPLEPDNFSHPDQPDLFQRMLDIEPTREEYRDGRRLLNFLPLYLFYLYPLVV